MRARRQPTLTLALKLGGSAIVAVLLVTAFTTGTRWWINESIAAAADKAAAMNPSSTTIHQPTLPPSSGSGELNSDSGTETDDQRIRRLMAGAPWAIAYAWGGCDETPPETDACYQRGSTHIVLKPRIMRFEDCAITGLLAHEHRHYEQWAGGLYKLDRSGALVNEAWIEDDARRIQAEHGC